MFEFLKKPLPFQLSLQSRFLAAASVSLFVFMFLWVFKPFGISGFSGNITAVCAGYGIVTFISMLAVSVAFPVFFPGLFFEEKWTVSREIIYTLAIITVITAGNVFYSSWIWNTRLSVPDFVNFGIITIAVAVIPVAVISLVKQNILLRRNLKSAARISENLYHKERLTSKIGELITIPAGNTRDDFRVEAGNLLYIKAADNYVEAFYVDNQEVKSRLVRATLRNTQSNLKKYSQFYRCHRTYIVNLEKIVRVTGNAQGYKLILEKCDEVIPVARSMNQEITMRLSR
jgi:hypothetical protein